LNRRKEPPESISGKYHRKKPPEKKYREKTTAPAVRNFDLTFFE